jgi:hypothetical protein
MSPRRKLYGALGAVTLLAVALAILLIAPRSSIKAVRRSTVVLDESPQPSATGPSVRP